jgi:hypothetical protein
LTFDSYPLFQGWFSQIVSSLKTRDPPAPGRFPRGQLCHLSAKSGNLVPVADNGMDQALWPCVTLMNARWKSRACITWHFKSPVSQSHQNVCHGRKSTGQGIRRTWLDSTLNLLAHNIWPLGKHLALCLAHSTCSIHYYCCSLPHFLTPSGPDQTQIPSQQPREGCPDRTEGLEEGPDQRELGQDCRGPRQP